MKRTTVNKIILFWKFQADLSLLAFLLDFDVLLSFFVSLSHFSSESDLWTDIFDTLKWKTKGFQEGKD